MPSPLIPFKRIISPPPISLQTHPFAIPIRRKQLRLNYTISHGPSPSQQKSDSSQKKSRNQHISERTDPTPNRRINHVVQERSNCNMGQNSAKVEMCGSPAAGRQTYKVDREFRTSRRALNVLSVRAGLPEQAMLPYTPTQVRRDYDSLTIGAKPFMSFLVWPVFSN